MYLHWIDVEPQSVSELLWYLQTSPPPFWKQPVLVIKVELSGAVVKVEKPAPVQKPITPAKKPQKSTPVKQPATPAQKPQKPTPVQQPANPAQQPQKSQVQPVPQPSPPEVTVVPRPQPPRLFALIIGINQYEDDKISNLKGAVADADAFQHFLMSELGVPEDRIVNLRDAKATRNSILQELRNLAKNPQINSQDPIFIFYAGHGGEADPPPGWSTSSTNGKIQMLIPHDFALNGSKDLRKQGIFDIQLSQILTNLAKAKSDNITVFLDSCHSGSGTRNSRDETLFVRGVELPPNYKIAENVLEEEKRAAKIAAGYEKAGLNSHILLAACMQGQTAKERQGRGAFTSEVLSLLRAEGVDRLTYSELIKHLPDLDSQNPQCEGTNQSRVLFNSRVTARSRELFQIRASSVDGQYILEAGEAHGITSHAEFAVYPDRKISSSLIGKVVTSDVTPFNSRCVAAPNSSFTLPSPAYALLTRVGQQQDLRLFVEAKEGFLNLFMWLGQDMQRTDPNKRSICLLNNSEGADLALTVTEEGFVQFHIMEKRCREYGMTTMPFYDIPVNGSDEYLISILRSAADFYWNLHHSNKDAKIMKTGKISLECLQLVPSDELTDDLEEILEPVGENLLKDGTIIIDVDQDFKYGFRINNGSTLPLYAALFYFDVSDLSVVPYYQPGTDARGQVDISLPPKGTLTIGYGDSGTVPYSYFLRENQNVDVGFLKLYLSTEYVDYSQIAQKSPFRQDRASNPEPPKKRYLWDTLTIPVIQKPGVASRCFGYGGYGGYGGGVGIGIGGGIGIGIGGGIGVGFNGGIGIGIGGGINIRF